VSDVGDILRKRQDTKVRVEAAQRALQEAHNQLVMAKAVAKSDLDPGVYQGPGKLAQRIRCVQQCTRRIYEIAGADLIFRLRLDETPLRIAWSGR
jgi:hypothetical protein